MKKLRLGTYDLPPGEAVLVQTLFRLFQQEDSFGWSLVAAPPYDALLADGTTAKGQSADVDAMAKALLRLTRGHASDAPNTLQRPIRAERLRDWLAAIASDSHRAPTAKPVATPSKAAAPDAPESTGPDAADSADGTRFKLRRWPPTIALRGDANRIRMATMLSRRALSVTELAALSRQSESDCRGFLVLLRSSGLVEQLQPAATVGAPAAAAAPAAPRPALGRGLIAGIRRRLGL